MEKKVDFRLNGIITLRLLTRKSRLSFGKYANLTVQELLNLSDSFYLVWVYYNCPGISFVDEVLDELFIDNSIRIKKPGKDSGLYEKVISEFFKKIKEKEKHSKGKFTIKKIHERRLKNKRMGKMVRTIQSVSFTKRQMQAMNHGRM